MGRSKYITYLSTQWKLIPCSQNTWASYSNIEVSISAICLVGAGLTYAGLTSATRGDVGLMSWAFSLFLVGLVVSSAVQLLLSWFTRIGNFPFTTPRHWEIILGISVYGSFAAVIGAITLLVVTVFKLAPDAGGGDSSNSDLIFSASPRPAAIVSFFALGAGLIIACVVFTSFSLANGVQALIWSESSERRLKGQRKLDDLDVV